jgi:hypothetical protein
MGIFLAGRPRSAASLSSPSLELTVVWPRAGRPGGAHWQRQLRVSRWHSESEPAGESLAHHEADSDSAVRGSGSCLASDRHGDRAVTAGRGSSSSPARPGAGH